MLESKPPQITIVIVAYHGDFVLLDRCLKSIDKHCIIEQIASIKIILNDLPVYLKPLKDIVRKLKRLPIEIIPSAQLEPVITEYFNWNTQQLFKILSCEVVETEWYLIHDCKDYYVAPVDFFKECFTADGRAITKLDHTQYSDYNKHGGGFLPFNLAYEVACNVWGVSRQDTAVWHLPTTTPFFVKRQMMAEMLQDLRNMIRGFLPYLFNLAINEERFATEFLMYSAYCFNRNKLKDYADWSVDNTYYEKFKQSKNLRVHFPSNPILDEKFFHNGRIWQFNGATWIHAIQSPAPSIPEDDHE
jgi:hypothetical protein